MRPHVGRASERRGRRQWPAAGPTARFLGVGIGLAAATAFGLSRALRLDAAMSWLGGINLATTALYVYDKAVSGSGKLRVPEQALLLLALVGGTPAAYASMRLAHHKTAKRAFQRRFWLIVTGQVVVIGVYLLVLKARLALLR